MATPTQEVAQLRTVLEYARRKGNVGLLNEVEAELLRLLPIVVTRPQGLTPSEREALISHEGDMDDRLERGDTLGPNDAFGAGDNLGDIAPCHTGGP